MMVELIWLGLSFWVNDKTWLCIEWFFAQFWVLQGNNKGFAPLPAPVEQNKPREVAAKKKGMLVNI